MNTADPLLVLFLGIGLFLTIASIVGWALAHRYPASPDIANLNARIRAWWVMVAVLAGAFFAGKAGIVVLFALISFGALREFLTIAKTGRGDHTALVAMVFVVLPAQYVLVYIEWYGLYSIFIPVYVFLLLPVVAALRGETERFMMRIAETQWGLMICVFCLSHVPALLTLDIPGFEGRQLQLIAFLLMVVQASDVLQYVWGKLLGRHKLAPCLSPSKTWEGLIGGVASATLLGACLWWITPFTFVQAGALALVAALMGFFGGLVMSAIKRDRGIKDWGWIIEGHGGVLDRLDSVIFAAPIFLHLVRYWWVP